jgi:Arc/MetJ-type ribon-helix-helix transcriptional regulator
MSNPYDPQDDPQLPEPIDDLMVLEDEPEHHKGARTASSVREIASRIPESLSAIGRDISRTIERAISAKDDYVVAVKVSHEAQEKLEQLVQAGVFRNRAEAAAFLIDEGIKTQSALFDRVQQKLAEIERLRAELRGMINEKPG